jgi:hypothetical protein
MALYVITFEGEGDTEAEIVNGRAHLDARIKEMWDEGFWNIDEEGPSVYELGKKMTASAETKITLKG